MAKQRPHIDEILTAYLAAQVKDKTGLCRRRVISADDRLRSCMEAEGHRILTDGDRSVLDLEREFDPVGAFARTMHADDLLFMLTIFVKDAWLPQDRVDRSVQLRYADGLATQIVAWRLVDQGDMSCALYELQGTIRRAKAALSTRSP